MKGIKGIGINGLISSGGVSCPTKGIITFYTACTVGDTFDPTITLRAGCPHTPQWEFGNGDTATGITISYAGYVDAGPHLVTLKIPDIGYWLTGIDIYNDKITGDFFGALNPCSSLTSITSGENTNLSSNLSSLVGFADLATLNLKEHQYSIVGDISNLAGLSNLTYIYCAGSGVYGDIGDLGGMTQLVYFDLHSNAAGDGVYGDLSGIASLINLTNLRLGNTNITGDLTDIVGMVALKVLMVYNTPVTGSLTDLAGLDGLQYIYITSSGISGGDVSGNPKIEYIIAKNMTWAQAVYDSLLASLYANRAIYTGTAYGARHYLDISGVGCAVPSGVYQDATPPTTGLEYVYKLANDPDAEGFKQWTILWNGGSAP